tara:strand:+ start:12 stop:716 length:705 start_codon:yes stop_codon:yes gene_type:complete
VEVVLVSIWGFVDVHKLHPKFDLIHERFNDIQKEFRDNINDIQFGHWYDDVAHDKNGGVYNPVAAPLYGEIEEEQEQLCMIEQFGHDFYEKDGLRTHKNVNLVPTLTKTLQDVGITRRASIASMKPKAKIPLHRDGDPNPPDGIVLRGIIGLDVPVEEGKQCYIMVRDRPKKTWHTREIKNQSVCLFQPNAIHSVINQLNGWRYVVLFDTVVWFENYPEIVRSCRTTGVWANLD